MRHLVTGITAGLLLAIPPLQAEELTTEMLPMLYFKLPFGSTQKAADPVYGLQFTQASFDRQGSGDLFQSERPAFLDFQMKGSEVNAFTVNGLNALTKTPVVYADGTTGTQTGINWWYVGIGVALVGGTVYAICETNDWDECDEGDDPPPAQTPPEPEPE